MTNILKSAIYIAAGCAFAACSTDWLDTEPCNGVDGSSAITSSEELATARIGVYQILKGTSTYDDYYAARMIYYGDVRGEDMQNEESGSRTKALYALSYRTASDAPTIWQTPYIVIRRANRVIEAAESGALTDIESNADIIGQYSAEAKVIRALAHFDLVRVYGKTYTADNGASYGVPIVLTALDAEAKLGRNTVAEVYAQVITDLTDAINSGNLAKEQSQGFVNEWTAKALLTRVYLTKGDNTNALAVAEDIIKNSPYTLWTNKEYAGAWNSNDGAHTNEVIFELCISGTTDWTDREGIANLYNEDGYADAIATKNFLDLINQDPKDVRLNVLLAPKTDVFIPKYGTNKVFVNKYMAMNQTNDIPLLRLSEVYLSAAEAAAKLSNSEKAATYLNAIVLRANPEYNEGNGVSEADATLERILIERRKELIGEGQRFFDAVRNNQKIVRYASTDDQGWHQILTKEAQSYDRDYYKSLLPIPQDELNANSVMVDQQNPKY